MSNPVNPTYYADFNGLEGLKSGAKADDPKAIRAAAQQFESLFTNMMLKSMREAKLGNGLGDSQESDLYQDMYDQQIALKMSQGKGLGLADMLVQQLTRSRAAQAAAGATGTSTPSVGAAGAASAPASTSDRISFVKSLEPYATQAARQLGVAPDTLIAQAALETGWGRHVPVSSSGASSNNLFGIKSTGSWSGDSVNSLTTEVVNGQAALTPQSFRAYSSVQEGLNDYVTLLQRNARYSQALGTGADVNAFATGLARGGYASDPDYGQKLQSTAAAVKALRAMTPSEPLKILAGLPTTTGGES